MPFFMLQNLECYGNQTKHYLESSREKCSVKYMDVYWAMATIDIV